ncbi:manganese efflux pump MntP family protein [Helicobacter sp. MIT 05-5294]|uniref:manganese efflux pump MntP n=1 Tax=Helicobacter sp. MIT 05-5294 TaxID=1548150 RepID=UPI00051FEB35|nr:manganese efflux pump MntP family protein [Helicobacter sp. MIT 05-5294]TLD86528.1 manganese efflux pump [Helicobacter sp. MIT 05-5294]
MLISYLEILLLGITLAVDACIIAFSYGLALKPWRLYHGLQIALVTAFFQFLMPLVGWLVIWFINDSFSDYVSMIDHWITFIVFLLLGIKIIKDSNSNEEKQTTPKDLSLWILLVIGIATSIDALAAGVMIFSQNTPLLPSALLIGIITFVCVFVAYLLSKTFHKFPSRPLEILAGCILILLGFKVLLEHIGF